MTALDPQTFARAFLALTAAIDAGDDSCLPVLADWLEEAGCQTQRSWRIIADASAFRPCPPCEAIPHGWSWRDAWNWAWEGDGRGRLHSEFYDRLCAQPMPRDENRRGLYITYPTRSAALMALAEALA